MPSLQELKNQIARAAFGMTPAQAHAKGVCISCKEPVVMVPKTTAFREYRNSALCEKCFDRISVEVE